MKVLKQFDTLVIEDFEEKEFHHPSHSQNYYEIVYIFHGDGLHWLNTICIPYGPGDLFLISPDDRHYFEIKNSTRFAIIKFTDSYFSNKRHLAPDNLLFNRPETMMRNKALKEVKLALNENAAYLLHNTICNIIAARSIRWPGISPFVYYQVLSVFGLINEAVARQNISLSGKPADITALLTYIHQHIYEPGEIQATKLAVHFNIAPNYFSAYFNRNFGTGYREYINNYRVKLIKKRVMAGLTLKQIADEFGFGGESHLAHFFRKQTGLSPGQYRAQENGGR